MSQKDGGPAFPYSALIPDNETRQMIGTIYADNRGMSLRAYFAAKAMQGLLANPHWNTLALELAGITESQATMAMARVSIMYADRLLTELNKEAK